MKITTPSGYEVEIKDVLTFRDKRSIDSVMYDSVKAEDIDRDDVEKSKKEIMGKVKPSELLGSRQDKSIDFLVISIKIGETLITENFANTILDWGVADAQVVTDIIDKIVDPKKNEENKTIETK